MWKTNKQRNDQPMQAMQDVPEDQLQQIIGGQGVLSLPSACGSSCEHRGPTASQSTFGGLPLVAPLPCPGTNTGTLLSNLARFGAFEPA